MAGKILILNPYYLPGYRSGGPQRTVENLVDYFGKRYDIYILTQDHDFGDTTRYEGIVTNTWTEVGDAKVMYVSTRDYQWKAIKKAYAQFDVIYSCGLFERNTVALLLIHRFSSSHNKKVYIAPMGVFSEGAFYNKSHAKKRLFVSLYNFVGAFKNIKWSFTTSEEARMAERILKRTINADEYIIAEDLPRKVDFNRYRAIAADSAKEAGKLNLVYISRIPPKKNLLYALELLSFEYNGQIAYDIYGVREDEKYWRACEEKMSGLPENIHVNYRGELTPQQVVDTFSGYDAFLFPTKGENYGHIIYEALSAGCVPIISNLTPWKGECALAHGLDDADAFREDIRRLMGMERRELIKLKNACIDYAESAYIKSTADTGYEKVFQ